MAFRFVVCNAESGVVKFHELVTHFETVATGIERLLELTLRHNSLLFRFREVVFALSRVQTETIVQTGEVVAVEEEYSSFSLVGGQLIPRSRCLKVFGRLFGTGGCINIYLRPEYFCVVTNSIFKAGFCSNYYKSAVFGEINLQGILQGLHFFHFTACVAIANVCVPFQIDIVSYIVKHIVCKCWLGILS